MYPCQSKIFLNIFLYISAPIPEWMLQNQRVIGGQVSREMVPWQVSIQHFYSGGHHCGGIILDENTILSADHCFKPFSKYKIKAGSVDAYGSTGQVSSPNYEIVVSSICVIWPSQSEGFLVTIINSILEIQFDFRLEI